MADRAQPQKAQDKLAFLLSLVPYLMDRDRVSVGEAAAHFGVPEEQIREAARDVQDQVAGRIEKLQLGNRFAGFGDSNAFLALVGTFQNVVHPSIHFRWPRRVGGWVESGAQNIQIVAAEAEHRIWAQPCLHDAGFTDTQIESLGQKP